MLFHTPSPRRYCGRRHSTFLSMDAYNHPRQLAYLYALTTPHSYLPCPFRPNPILLAQATAEAASPLCSRQPCSRGAVPPPSHERSEQSQISQPGVIDKRVVADKWRQMSNRIRRLGDGEPLARWGKRREGKRKGDGEDGLGRVRGVGKLWCRFANSESEGWG